MVAAFNVRLDTAGSDNNPGTQATITNLRFKTADDNTQDTNNPIPIVSAATKYSYWRQVYLEASTAPDTQVDNIKFYTDGGDFGTGITMNIADQFPVKNSGADTGYDLATGTPGDTGNIMTDHTDISSVTDAFSFTSGSALTGPSISEGGSIIADIDDTSNYIVLQLVVTDSASPGTKTAETLTFQYDEI